MGIDYLCRWWIELYIYVWNDEVVFTWAHSKNGEYENYIYEMMKSYFCEHTQQT